MCSRSERFAWCVSEETTSKFRSTHDSIGLDILRLPIEVERANAPRQTCEDKNIKQQTPWLEGVKYRVVQIDVSQEPNLQRER